MRKTVHLVVALILALASVGSVYAQTSWMSYGVVGDGIADDSGALNNLPPNIALKGDCKAGGSIRLLHPWLLKSNLTVIMDPSCQVKCDWVTTAHLVGCISQDDLEVPVTNVDIEGLYFIRTNPNYKGRALYFWVDHLTMKSLTVDGFYSMALIRGGDQEWAAPTFKNTPGGAGNQMVGTSTHGFSHLGNMKHGAGKPATTPGRHANVWVHDANIQGTGDGALQIGASCQDDNNTSSNWRNTSADDYIYENSIANAAAGNMIFIGTGAQGSDDTNAPLKCDNVVLSNLFLRAITGTSESAIIRVQNANNPWDPNNPTAAIFQNITLQNITGDASASIGGNAFIAIRGLDGSKIDSLTATHVTVTKQFGGCLDVSAYPATNLMFDTVFCDAPKQGVFPTATIRSTSGTIIQNSRLPARSGTDLTGGSILLGPAFGTGGSLVQRVNGGNYNVDSPQLLNNTFANITSIPAIRLGNVNGALVSGNTTLTGGGNTGKGGSLTAAAIPPDPNNPGSQSNTVTDNNFTQTPNFGCLMPPNTNQGNLVSGNTPAAANCP